jgi:hypothetical protein
MHVSGSADGFSVGKGVFRRCVLEMRFTKSREFKHEEIPMNINLAMIEPTDDGVLEDLAKKRVHHGEEALMLAVLKNVRRVDELTVITPEVLHNFELAQR